MSFTKNQIHRFLAIFTGFLLLPQSRSSASLHHVAKQAYSATCDPALACPTALHPIPASVPCNVCGRQMQRKKARRTGQIFYGCSGFVSHRCRFVRSKTGHKEAPRYQVEIRAEMETEHSFRLIACPPFALKGLLRDAGLANNSEMSWAAREDGQEGAVFPLHRYGELRRRIAHLRSAALVFEWIPTPTLRAFSHSSLNEKWKIMGSRSDVCSMLPPAMRDSLCAYQRQGIEFVVAKHGRALIADDMGLGKSVQALGAAVCMQGWPLLIICPATMRLVWAEECERWLPNLTLVLMDAGTQFTCVTSTKVRILTRGELRQTSTSSSLLLTSFRDTHQKS